MAHMLPNNSIPHEEIPVLLTIFNRPDKTRAVIENLRQIKPKRLFVAADGPRLNLPQDVEKCRLARQEATSVDWPCDVTIRFLDDNIGCDPAVSTAIDWFFQHVEYGIILEDDGLVHPHFFTFCEDIFVRYFDDERIMQISSLSPYASREYPYDYHFSRMFRCSGGWGTWRRAWKYFTSDFNLYREDEAREVIKAYYPDYSKSREVLNKFLECKNGIINYWDFQWNIACFAQNGLSIVPERNLMLNIGFGEDSTHTCKLNPVFEGLQVHPLTFPLRHPPLVCADSLPERSLEKKMYRSLPLKSRCKYLVHQALGAISYFHDVMPFD